jgi:hypothetical protein
MKRFNIRFQAVAIIAGIIIGPTYSGLDGG